MRNSVTFSPAGFGHVFESTDSGATWTDISGNLPDAPGDDLVVVNGKLVVATDIGVFGRFAHRSNTTRSTSGTVTTAFGRPRPATHAWYDNPPINAS